MEGTILNNLASVSCRLGDLVQAQAYREAALAVRAEAGDTADVAQFLSDMGTIYMTRGGVAGAISYHQQALDLRREIGDRAGEAQSCWGSRKVHRLVSIVRPPNFSRSPSRSMRHSIFHSSKTTAWH